MATAPAFEIERGVPLPEASGSIPKYPFREMDVGDSFTLPLSKRTLIASAMGRYAPKRFTCRKISETECRCWRIA